MKPSTTVARLAAYLSWLIGLILVILPFHAFLTVWTSSSLGHYTLLRLWKEGLLSVVFAGVIYILAVDSKLRKQLFGMWLYRLTVIYTVLLLVCGGVALARHNVSHKALAYGLLLDLRFLFFFLMAWTVAAYSPMLHRNWRKLLLIPGAIVAGFGLLQYLVLPNDFLKHFGYGPATISPYETINHNIKYIRIESTLRGANPLGAYLLLLISAVTASGSKNWRAKHHYLLLAAAVAALFFSYSRSAWIGALISILIIMWLTLKTQRAKELALAAGSLIMIAGLIAVLVLRHNTAFQNDLFHTDSQSQVAVSSNQGHAAAFRAGLHDISHQPLGEGPGTAGPASFYNNHSPRIAENYYLQVGQEAGILGLALFAAINLVVGRMLWLRRADPLALALLASLIGLSFVNMLSHAWTDDTLAYIWWGLAGISLAPDILKANKHKPDEKIEPKPA